MSIIKLPGVVILEIFSYITDQSTLANVSLTCKTLNNAVSSHRYHTFPVSEDELANCSMRKIQEKFAHLTALSTRNVGFIPHLVIDPITDLMDPEVVASLRRCTQLHSLTLYIANSLNAHSALRPKRQIQSRGLVLESLR